MGCIGIIFVFIIAIFVIATWHEPNGALYSVLVVAILNHIWEKLKPPPPRWPTNDKPIKAGQPLRKL